MNRLCLAAGVLVGAITPAFSDEPRKLTPTQQEVISHGLRQLSSHEERDLAAAWADAKKVAEFICRPIALPGLQKWNRDADRVFLGTDDPQTLSLESDQLLKGSGQVRTGSDWIPFQFTCKLDPNTGKALAFQTDLPPRR